MLVRVLLVVLTLGAPLPYRVCTCGAAAADRADAGHPGEAPACGHDHRPADAGTRHPHDHDHDCPCAKAQPPAQVTDPAAGDLTAPTATGDFLSLTHTALPPARGTTTPPAHPPRGPTRPLFITLLTLRN